MKLYHEVAKGGFQPCKAWPRRKKEFLKFLDRNSAKENVSYGEILQSFCIFPHTNATTRCHSTSSTSINANQEPNKKTAKQKNN